MHGRIALILFTLGLIGLGVWKVVQPKLDLSDQSSVSDAGEKGLIRIAVDGWVGYFPLCSVEMKSRLRRLGYGLNCEDDRADYDQRFKKLRDGDYDFVVATVDSYLLNAEKYNFPGPIIAVIDESKGGDAIVARRSTVSSIDELKQGKPYKVAFTPNSPSHHLLKAVATHFDVPQLRERQRHLETNGSEEALTFLKNNKADIAVLWEPEVSRALSSDEYVRLLGTEVTKELIVDILVGSRDVVKDNQDMVLSLLKAYFETLKFYREDTETFIKHIKRHYNIKTDISESLLTGVEWATLSDNGTRWFGIEKQRFSSESIIVALNSAASILLDNGDFDQNPIPNRDPYVLTNSSFIKKLYEAYGQSGSFLVEGARPDGQFEPLSDQEWDALSQVGSMKTRKITFSSGTDELALDGKMEVDAIVADIKHYPNFRIEVRGHTAVRGDAQANLALSKDRAETVARYMTSTHEIDKNRLRAVGFGGSRPLEKRAGESSRSYNYRLPRVEIILVGEVL